MLLVREIFLSRLRSHDFSECCRVRSVTEYLVNKRMEYLEDNIGKLSPHIRAEIRVVRRNFRRMSERVSTDLTTFISDTNEVYESAIKDIDRPPRLEVDE